MLGRRRLRLRDDARDERGDVVQPEIEVGMVGADTDGLEEHRNELAELRRAILHRRERLAELLRIDGAALGLPPEELHRRVEARERRAELVRRDRDELVARGHLSPLDLAEARLGRGERQGGERGDRRERLQQEQRFVLRPSAERTVLLERAPDRDRREHDDRGRRLARAEAERHPHEDREDEELLRVVLSREWLETAEH